jgi:hypothetical protein
MDTTVSPISRLEGRTQMSTSQVQSQTHWLSTQDLTTPAPDRLPEDDTPPQPRPARGVGGLPSALVFLAAVWLLVGAYPVAYRGTGRFDVWWTDVVVGLALAGAATVWLVRPGELALAGVVGVLGAWVVAAPFVSGYGSGGAALWSHVVLGTAIVALSLAGAALPRPEQTAIGR